MKLMHVICNKYGIDKVIDLNRIDEMGCNIKTNTIYIKADNNDIISIKMNKEENTEAICTKMLEQYLDKTVKMDSFIINIDNILKELANAH